MSRTARRWSPSRPRKLSPRPPLRSASSACGTASRLSATGFVRRSRSSSSWRANARSNPGGTMYLPTVKLEIAAGELALYDADVTDVYTVRDSVTVYFRKDNVRIRVSLPLETFVGALRKIGPEVREYVDRARTALNDLRD